LLVLKVLDGTVKNDEVNRLVQAGDDIGKRKDARALTGIRMITLVGLMAAIACIVGPLSIPLPITAVPISFTNLVIYFTVYLLGMKLGTLSYVIYILLGLVGLPVFGGFQGGVGVLAGPTGGYIIGFVFMALICGVFAERFHYNKWMYVVGMIIGLAVVYAFGTAWLAYQSGLLFKAALFAGVIPFIPGDVLKIVAVTIVALPARRLLNRALSYR
jgi:biotin transport system substrate-specific component